VIGVANPSVELSSAAGSRAPASERCRQKPYFRSGIGVMRAHYSQYSARTRHQLLQKHHSQLAIPDRQSLFHLVITGDRSAALERSRGPDESAMGGGTNSEVPASAAPQ